MNAKKRGSGNMPMQNPCFYDHFSLKISNTHVFAFILCVRSAIAVTRLATAETIRATLTAKTQGFENMEDKLTVKTQGFGISMLSRPHFLQGFRVSKLSTAWLGWILYLDHTKHRSLTRTQQISRKSLPK
jgi:hypothetical protein